MNKIPTIFVRDDDNRKIIDAPNPDCLWVFAGQGIATEKIDGTNVRLTIRSGTCVRLEKRRNPSKEQKKADIIDPWYVDASPEDPADKWIYGAVDGSVALPGWPDGEHSCEAVGPKIQGNPLGLRYHTCYPFTLYPSVYAQDVARGFNRIRSFLEGADSVFSPGNRPEGLVFHHPDGRMAKIKWKDFVGSGR